MTFCEIISCIFADLTFEKSSYFLPLVITHCFTNYLFSFYISVLKDVNATRVNI